MPKLNALKVAREKTPGVYGDGAGLYMRITPEGSKSWVFRYTLAGKAHWMGLGPVSLYSLAEARQMALEARRLAHQGTDPIEHRKAQRASLALEAAKAMTFNDCRHAYYKAHRAGWRSTRHAMDWDISIQNFVSPTLGALPVAAVDTAMVMRVLEPHWATKTETMSRVRGRIEAILAWATVRGYRSGPNPAQWKNHLDKLLPARAKTQRVEHFASLPYGEAGAFMAKLRAHSGTHILALELVILTAVRSGEALQATWEEFDLGAKVWTIPAAHTKTHKEHRVPLSDAAVAVIGKAQVLRHSNRVFPLGHQRLGKIPRELGYDVTVHGMRATFRTWAAETTAYPHQVVEMALGHAIGDKVEAAYQRGDLFEKRVRLMDAWARFCASSNETAKVYALR